MLTVPAFCHCINVFQNARFELLKLTQTQQIERLTQIQRRLTLLPEIAPSLLPSTIRETRQFLD